MARRRARPHVKPPARTGDQDRARIAHEAARVMAEEGVQDFQSAKRKAAWRLNLSDSRNLPTNEEIDAALTDRLRLFHTAEVSGNARRLREIAAEAMVFLEKFEPRLVGSVLAGTVTSASKIQLHLSADTPEQLGLFLGQHHIPYRLGERRMRFGGERYLNIPTYEFVADGATVELSVFNPRAARETPLSPVDGRPMQRGTIKEIQSLLSE